jgi:hypothetical protein
MARRIVELWLIPLTHGRPEGLSRSDAAGRESGPLGGDPLSSSPIPGEKMFAYIGCQLLMWQLGITVHLPSGPLTNPHCAASLGSLKIPGW